MRPEIGGKSQYCGFTVVAEKNDHVVVVKFHAETSEKVTGLRFLSPTEGRQMLLISLCVLLQRKREGDLCS